MKMKKEKNKIKKIGIEMNIARYRRLRQREWTRLQRIYDVEVRY